MYIAAESSLPLHAIWSFIDCVLAVQQPWVPPGETAGVPMPQFWIVVVPLAQSANAQSLELGASICTVGSTLQPNVSVPWKTIQSTSPVPDETAATSLPLLSQSSIVPSGVARISLSLGSSISPEQVSGGIPVSIATSFEASRGPVSGAATSSAASTTAASASTPASSAASVESSPPHAKSATMKSESPRARTIPSG